MKPKRKDKYQSKEYRRFLRYLSAKYLSATMAESLQGQMRRPGFMRRILDTTGTLNTRAAPVSEAHESFLRERVPYLRGHHYDHLIPDDYDPIIHRWSYNGKLAYRKDPDLRAAGCDPVPLTEQSQGANAGRAVLLPENAEGGAHP